MLLLVSGLAAFSLWIVLAELPGPGVRRLPTDFSAAAVAATARGRAAWAAAFGAVRGDLWAEAAFTYATLLSPDPAQDADPSRIANQARIVIERALACAPHASSAWLLAARLGVRFNWPNTNPLSTLQIP